MALDERRTLIEFDLFLLVLSFLDDSLLLEYLYDLIFIKIFKILALIILIAHEQLGHGTLLLLFLANLPDLQLVLIPLLLSLNGPGHLLQFDGLHTLVHID